MQIKATFGVISMLLFQFSGNVEASSDKHSKLSMLIDSELKVLSSSHQPGCAVGVIHNGNYVHRAGYGLANLEHRVPITPRTVFRTGSVSKQFTATAIAILALQGKIDLDSDVHDYLPELVDYGHKVSIRQIVHHLAGMGDYDHEAFKNERDVHFRFGNQDYWTIREFYERVKNADLVSKPGLKWRYSNLGYFLLSQIVEKVSGKDLREFADQEIFAPLSMDSSFFNDNVNQLVGDRADGYKRLDDGSFEIFMTNLNWVGDGGVYTNLEDFIAWDRNFYENKLASGSSDLIDLITTPHPKSMTVVRNEEIQYGFGLFLGNQNGERYIGHSGRWVGFTSMYRRFPRLALSVVVFCNGTNLDAAAVGKKVAQIGLDSLSK